MALQIGSMTLESVVGGVFGLDGGAMFGVVPRPLWARKLPPDEGHRVPLVARCLLIRQGDRKVLVDAGLGQRWSDREREMFAIQPEVDLIENLEALGVAPEEITNVIITHLHWDHAGGLVLEEEGAPPRLAFPNATHHVQRRNWKWGHSPTERDLRSYRAEDMAPLEESGQLHFVEGATELLPGVELLPTEGHTVGQQLVKVSDGETTLLFCGDIIPTSAHLPTAWGMAYDLYPLTVIEEKKQILAQALEEGWILFFEHDPKIAACRLSEEGGKVRIAETFDF